jgi:tetratricopeptide (TPR) repeat protein
LGGEHPSVATSYGNIGSTWKTKGEYDKALEYYEKCLAIELKTLGGEHPSVAASYFNIGTCYQNLEAYEQAIKVFSAGYTISRKGGYPFRIAVCMEKLNNPTEALGYYLQSAEIRKDDSEAGIEAASTKESISNAKRLAQELGKKNELPEWMNKE